MEDDGFVACCEVKRGNKRKYNLSGSVYLLQDTNVTGISTKWFLNFPKYVPRESTIGLSLWEFRIIESSRNRG